MMFGEEADPFEGLEAMLDAVEDMSDITFEPGDENKLSTKTLQEVSQTMSSLATLFKQIRSLMDSAKALKANPDGSMPTSDTISGSNLGDAGALAIVGLGKWDDWIAESDQQMDFAVRGD